jgi:hypothetical protein
MVIILILWHVRQGKEKAFIKAWKEEFYVNNRDKLIGEFLSKPVDAVEDRYKSLTVATFQNPTEPVTAYVNVGIWDSLDAFKSEIAQYIPDPGAPPLDFEVARYRIVLEPVAWRIGRTDLLRNDSGRTY